MVASYKSVQAFDLVDEALLQQELQGPVDRGRGGRLGILRSQPVEQGIGADRYMAVPDHLEDPPAQGGHFGAPFLANDLCTRQGIVDAMLVIVWLDGFGG